MPIFCTCLGQRWLFYFIKEDKQKHFKLKEKNKFYTNKKCCAHRPQLSDIVLLELVFQFLLVGVGLQGSDTDSLQITL